MEKYTNPTLCGLLKAWKKIPCQRKLALFVKLPLWNSMMESNLADYFLEARTKVFHCQGKKAQRVEGKCTVVGI